MLSPLFALGVGMLAAALAPEAREDPTAVLEDLIRRTNELRTFHATYRLSIPEEQERPIELWYEAPDSLRMDIGTQSSDDERSQI